MSQRGRVILKSYFEKGDFPTQAEFIDLIDSVLNLLDDSVGGGDMFKSTYDANNNGIVDNSELIAGDTVPNDSAVQANTSKVSYDDAGNVVLLTGNQTVAGEKTLSNNLKVNAQAHGGDTLEGFSASKEFDADDGNNQEMEVTASTAISITNELPGTFLIWLPINSGASPGITPDASLGTKANNSDDFSDVDGDINLVTIAVSNSGIKIYTITVITP